MILAVFVWCRYTIASDVFGWFLCVIIRATTGYRKCKLLINKGKMNMPKLGVSGPVDGILNLNEQATQRGFGMLVGITQQSVKQYVDKSIIPKGGTYKEWLILYTAHQRQQAMMHGNDENKALTAAKTEEVMIRSATQRIVYNEKIGSLVRTEAAESLMNDWATYAVREIENEIDTMATKIEQKLGEEIPSDITAESTRAIRERITNHAEQLGKRLVETSQELET